MVVGLKMASKMRLKELNKVLESIKEKSLVKAKQDSAAGKRKGKEPMSEPIKKRRALILEDEEDEDDITLSAFALKNLQSCVSFQAPEDEEHGKREETEKRDEEREARRIEEEEGQDDYLEPTFAGEEGEQHHLDAEEEHE